MFVREMAFVGADWIHLDQDNRPLAGSCEHIMNIRVHNIRSVT
jgi:hypothetical protein